MLDWRRATALFPGQGSQALGMAADIAREYPIARDTFAEADEILGYSLSEICWQGPADMLDQTVHTQPALYVSSLAIWRVLRDLLPAAQPAWLAGHSLGELSALTAAGALDFADGLRLVRARGSLMQRAGEAQPGAMAAVLGLEIDVVRELCAAMAAESGGTVVLANDNCPGQAVVSGEVSAVDALINAARSAGARRALRLAVSVAAHSPLMAAAQADFHAAVQATEFSKPTIPIIGNVNAQPLHTTDQIRAELHQQLTQPVRWTESMTALLDIGTHTFVEIGSGKVLTGLLRRINRQAMRINIDSLAALELFLGAQA
ncbi:MAG: ACP S-malonyltransferase [Chloroflexi bacterium]|nr:ACP S-malonyltransferase [Chloroflexota bacterium]MCY3582775.1 ACP S-malonyltransferase [Chloroflexota bacterium]MCY3715466.1 ACP S-malonyltransferase [Chloroflexota bacterium]MDE2650302.1 ACP S-malonyltransferase [Chloroflexota bacterium]MXX82774.1 ACP S-malonyltransferase [Chloroflexota bacterium]